MVKKLTNKYFSRVPKALQFKKVIWCMVAVNAANNVCVVSLLVFGGHLDGIVTCDMTIVVFCQPYNSRIV